MGGQAQNMFPVLLAQIVMTVVAVIHSALHLPTHLCYQEAWLR